MPDRELRLHIICYDIADPKRLNSVHRFLKKHAVPIQYSVFMALVNKQGLDRLLIEIQSMIEEEEDDVRAYPVPHHPVYERVGKQLFPVAIATHGAPLDIDP